jgi:hypothetical protein
LSANARWFAWVERDAARTQGILPHDPNDVKPPMPKQGYVVSNTEALTAKSSWFLDCGHFVCVVPHPEARYRMSCADVHSHRCKRDGRYNLESLRQQAMDQGILSAKLKKLASSSDKVSVLDFHSNIVRMDLAITMLCDMYRLQGSLQRILYLLLLVLLV